MAATMTATHWRERRRHSFENIFTHCIPYSGAVVERPVAFVTLSF